MQDTQKINIFTQVQITLKEKLESSQSFREELEQLYFYYERKLLQKSKTEEQRMYIVEHFEEFIMGQYFQGYYVMTEILLDKDFKYEENIWEAPIGIARNEIPIFLEQMFKEENIDWTRTELGHSFIMHILENNHHAYDLAVQIKKDIANYGAYKAFIEDERYKGENTTPNNHMLLGNAFDLEFISPQVYMQAQFNASQHEVWDLFTWSSLNNTWVGTVHYSRIPTKETEYALLEISLSNTIIDEEKMEIASVIVSKLPEENRELLQTRLYHVENFDALIND